MANVKVIIEELVKGKGEIDRVTKDLGQLDSAALKASRSAKTSSTAWTELRSAYSTVLDVINLGVKAWDATAGKTMKFADEVRQLSSISGESAENTSRFLQVLDDYKIGTENVTTAVRTLTKEGYAPNIDTLAKLSDEYLSISDAQERNEFILKNLGRSGLEWVEVLEKGGDALRDQAAAIDENLILNQKQVDAARRMEIAQDQLNDTALGWGNIVGNILIPAGQTIVSSWAALGRALEIARDKHINFISAFKEASIEVKQEQDALLKQADAAEQSAESTETATESQEDAEAAVKKLTSAYQGLLSSMFSIQKSNEGYTRTVADLQTKTEELEDRKKQLTLRMWEEQRAGKMTNEENLKYVQQLAEITQEQEENSKKIEQAAIDREKESKQRIYDLAQQRLAADGVVTSGEFEYMQDLAVSYGLVSREAANMAVEEMKKADALVASFLQVQNPMMTDLELMKQLYSYNGKTVNFGINYASNQSSVNTAYNPAVLGNLGASGDYGGLSVTRGGGKKRRDSGGEGIAGQPYMIGTGAQPEAFIPDTNGTFIPNADKSLGNTYNIVINNPKKEAAENSIRVALKKLSSVGAAQ